MSRLLKTFVTAVALSLLMSVSVVGFAYADSQTEHPYKVESLENNVSGSVAAVSTNGKNNPAEWYGVYDWSFDNSSNKLVVTYKEPIQSEYTTSPGRHNGNKFHTEDDKIFIAKPFSEIGSQVKALELHGFDTAGYATGLSSLKEVVFGKDIVTIDDGAFSDLPDLKDVKFEQQSKLETIASNAFGKCTSLKSIDFSNCTESKKLGATVSGGAFGGGNNPNETLNKVVLPSNLETLGTKLFAGCTKLESIELPSTLKNIEEYVFQDTAIKSIVLPENVQKIDNYAFSYTSQLKYIIMHYVSGMSVGTDLRSVASSEAEQPELIILDTVDDSVFTPVGKALKYVFPYKVVKEIADMDLSLDTVGSIVEAIADKYNNGLSDNAKNALTADQSSSVSDKLAAAKALAAINALDTKTAADENDLNEAKAGYAALSDAAKSLISSDVQTVVDEKIKAEEAKLDAAKNPPSGGDTGGNTGGSGGGGSSVAPTPSQHEHVWGTGVETVKATCTTAGTMTYHCTVSGCTETKTEAIPALGHKFGEWVVTTSATTQAAGVETRTCSVCGATETRAIDKITDGSGSGSGTVTPGGDKVIVGTTVKVSGITYKVTASGKVKVNAVSKSVKGKKTVTIPTTVKVKGKTYKVAGISAKILEGAKATTLVIKSKVITKKGIKNSLKGSKVKTVKIAVSGKKSVNKTYVSKYKKFFTKANCGKSVKLLAA